MAFAIRSLPYLRTLLEGTVTKAKFIRRPHSGWKESPNCQTIDRTSNDGWRSPRSGLEPKAKVCRETIPFLWPQIHNCILAVTCRQVMYSV